MVAHLIHHMRVHDIGPTSNHKNHTVVQNDVGDSYSHPRGGCILAHQMAPVWQRMRAAVAKYPCDKPALQAGPLRTVLRNGLSLFLGVHHRCAQDRDVLTKCPPAARMPWCLLQSVREARLALQRCVQHSMQCSPRGAGAKLDADRRTMHGHRAP